MLTDQDVVTGMIVRIVEVYALELTKSEKQQLRYKLARIIKKSYCKMCNCDHYEAVFIDNDTKVVGRNLGLNAKIMVKANVRQTR